MDKNPPREKEEEWNKKLRETRTNKYDLVALEKRGVGARGYVLKEILVKRGKGSGMVNPMFKRVVDLGYTHPDKLPKQVRNKLEFGPRVASMKYR